MHVGWLLLILVLNFIVSIFNAKSVGRMWSESKAIGGFMRVLAVSGYIMAIAGFTMVYGMLLLLILPHILILFPEFSDIDAHAATLLAMDMMYLLIVMTVIPTGLIIWFNSLVHFWRQKTLANGLVLGWNTYAQVRNMANAIRHVPGALERITKALFGGRKRGNAIIFAVAIFVIILAVIGGWLTASGIMKKADKNHNGFDGLERICKNPKINEMRTAFKVMTLPQKEAFIRNLDAKLKNNSSQEYKDFLQECITKYNEKAKRI